MRKTENFEIDGHKIEIFQLPVPISIKVLTRLTKILAKPLGDVIGDDGNAKDAVKSALDKKIDMGAILGSLGDKLDEEIVTSTIQMMLPYISIDQKQVKNLESFDEFGVLFLLKVIAKALEVNYGDFFGGLLARGVKEPENQEKELTQPKT